MKIMRHSKNGFIRFLMKMVKIQNAEVDEGEEKFVWTPSKMIRFLGEKINNRDSVYYWCYKNNIPVYCPAITDGSIGDMLCFYNFSEPLLTIDIVRDIVAMNKEAIYEDCTGMIILGGGIIKHHILNANLMRNGSDYCVFVNTAQEFDGSDAGAKPEEGVSWGKVRPFSKHVKIHGEATIIFPILVSQTFAKIHEEKKKKEKEEKVIIIEK